MFFTGRTGAHSMHFKAVIHNKSTIKVWSKSRYKCFEAFDQLEERILQTDQLKNASKRLQHRVDQRCTFNKNIETN